MIKRVPALLLCFIRRVVLLSDGLRKIIANEGHVIDNLVFELELYNFDRRFQSSHRRAFFVELIVDEVLHRVELWHDARHACLNKDVSCDRKSGIFAQSDFVDVDLLVLPVSNDLCIDLAPCILDCFVELW